MNEVMNHVIDYMDRRTSKNVNLVKEIPELDVERTVDVQLLGNLTTNSLYTTNCLNIQLLRRDSVRLTWRSVILPENIRIATQRDLGS